MTLETQSEAEAKRKRSALCQAVCVEISNEHLELILSAGGFSRMATARLVRQVESLMESLRSTLLLCRLKYGNRDPDANQIFDKAGATIEAIESNSPIPESVPKWKPIETAPRDGTRILTWRKGPIFDRSEWYQTSELCGLLNEKFFLGWPQGVTPTHWMPLPEAPKP